MTREFYTTIIANGGLAGQSFDINLGPAEPDIIDTLLSVSGGTNPSALQENAPTSLISTGDLSTPKELDLSQIEINGRIFFLSVQNTDLDTNSLTITPSGITGSNINGETSLVVTTPEDYVFIYTVNGWRAQAVYTPEEKSNLELELEFKASQLTSFKELSYTGNNLTTVNIYTDNLMTILLFTKSLSYTGSKLVQTILTRISDGAVVTKDLTYSGNNLISVEATI